MKTKAGDKLQEMLAKSKLEAHKQRFQINLTKPQLKSIEEAAGIFNIKIEALTEAIIHIAEQMRVELSIYADRQEPKAVRQELSNVAKTLSKLSKDAKLGANNGLNANFGTDIISITEIFKYAGEHFEHPPEAHPRFILIQMLKTLIQQFDIDKYKRNSKYFGALVADIVELSKPPFNISTDEILKILAKDLNSKY